jgi:hypothetical protein
MSRASLLFECHRSPRQDNFRGAANPHQSEVVHAPVKEKGKVKNSEEGETIFIIIIVVVIIIITVITII